MEKTIAKEMKETPDHQTEPPHLPLVDSLTKLQEELYDENADISSEQVALLEFMMMNYSQLESNLKTLMES